MARLAGHSACQRGCAPLAAVQRTGDGSETFDAAGLRRLRTEVAEGRANWGHDCSAIRIESLRLALARCGDDETLATTGDAHFHTFSDLLQVAEHLEC